MPHEDSPTLPSPDGFLQSVLAWQNAFAGLLLQAQQSQFQILAAWQGSIAEAQRDLQDRWICRFGGGIPLDG
jgi:hypothetical protein